MDNLSKAWNKLILAEMQEPEPSDDLTEIVNLAPIYLDLANTTKICSEGRTKQIKYIDINDFVFSS